MKDKTLLLLFLSALLLAGIGSGPRSPMSVEAGTNKGYGIMGTTDKEDSEEWGKEEARNFKTTPKRPKVSSAESGSGEGSGFSRQIIAAGEGLLQKQFDKFKAPAASKLNRDVMGVTRVQTEEEAARIINEAVQERIKENTTPPPPGMPAPVPGGDMEKVQNVANKVISGTLPSVEHPEQETVGNPSIPDAIVGGGGQAGSQTNVQATGQTVTQPGQPGQNAISVQSNTNVNSDKASSETNMGVILDTNTTVSTYNITAPPPGSSIDVNMGKNGAHVMMTTVNSNNQTVDANGTYINPLYNPPDTAVTPQGTDAYNVSEVKPPQQQQPQTMPTSQPQQLQEPSQETIPTQKPSQQLQQTQAQLPQQPQETQEQAQATPQQQLATQDKQQATQGQEQETQLQQQATQVQQQATQLQQQANQQQEQATQLQQQAISQQQQAAQEQQQATNQQTQGGQAQQAAVPPPPPPPSVAPPPQPSSAPTVAQMQQPQQPWTYPQSESSTPANQSSTVSPSQSMPQQQSFQSVSNSPSPTIPAGGVVGRVNQLQGNGVPNAGQLPTPWYTQAGGVNGQPQSAASNNSVTARPSAGYTWPTITTEALRPTDYPPQVMNMSIGPTTPSGGYPISKNMNTPQTDQPTVPSTQNVGPMLSNAPGGKILIVSNTTFLIGGQGIGDKGGLSPTSNQPMAQNEASQPEVLPSINTQTQSRPTKDMFQGPESSLPTYSLPKNFTNAVYQNRPGSLPDEAVAETSVNISFPGAKPGQVVLLPKKVKNDPNEEAQLVPLVDKGKTTPQPTAPPPAHTFVPTVMGSKPTEIGTVGPTDMNQPTIIGSVTPTDHITTEMGTVVPTNPGPGLAPTPTMPTLAGDGYKIETSLRLKFGENKQLPLNMIVGDKDNTNLVKMPLGPSRERINNPMHFDEDMYQERSMAGQAVTTVTPSKPDIRPTPDPYGGIKDAILSVDISQLKPGQLLSLRLPNSHKSDLFKVKDIKTRDSSIEAFTKDEVGSHDGIQPSKRHLLYAIIEKVKKNRKYANAMKSLFTMGSRRSESESPLLIVKSALKRARIINLPKKDKSKKYTMKELERRSEEALEKMFQRNISKSTKATLHSKHSEEVEKRTLGLKHLYKKARIGRKTKKANRKGQDITGSKKTDGTFKITLKLKGESDDDSGLHVDEPPEEMNDPLFGKKKKLTFKGKFSDKKSKEDKSEEEEEEKEMGSKGGKKKGKYGKVGAGNGASQGENNNSQAGQEGGNMANGNGNQVNPQQQANTGNQVPQQSGNAGNNGDNGNIGGASNNNNNQANANTNQQMAGQGAGNTGDSPNTNQGINNTPAQENGNMGNTNQGINNNNNAIQQAGNMGNTIASNQQMSAAGVNGNTGNDNTGNVKNMTNVIIQDEKGNTIFKGPVNVATLNETVVKNGGGDKASFKLEKAGYKVEENTDSLGMAVIEKSLQKTFHPVKKTNLFKLTDHRNKRRRIRRSIEEKNQTTEENNASKRTEGTFEIELKMSDKKKKEESDEEFRDDTSKQSDKKKKMEFEGSFSDDKKEESDNIKKGSESKESFVVIKDEKGNILYKGMMDIDALKKTESDGKSEKLKIKKVDSDEPSDKEVLQDALQRVNAIRREGIAAAAKRIEGLTLELEMSDDKNAEAKIVPNDNKTNNKDSELAKKGQTKQGRKICNVFIEDAKGEVLYHGPIDISALKQTSEINPEVPNTPRKKTFPQNYANIDSPEITQAMGGSYPGVDDIMFDKGKKHRRSLELITGTPESQQDSSRADNPLPDSNADKKTDGTFKLMVEVADKDQNSDQNDAAARQIASTTHNDDDKKMTFSGTFMDDKEKGDEKKSDKKKAKKGKKESEEEESEGDKKKKKKTEENEEEEEKEKKKEKEDNEEDEDNKKKKKGENEKEEKKKKKKEENEEEDDKKKKKEENEEEEKKKTKGKGENEEEDDKKKKKENEEEDDKKKRKKKTRKKRKRRKRKKTKKRMIKRKIKKKTKKMKRRKRKRKKKTKKRTIKRKRQRRRRRKRKRNKKKTREEEKKFITVLGTTTDVIKKPMSSSKMTMEMFYIKGR
ncbi:predicted protein [Nematostella vectensis]|uniref:Uncharacterized protein n=1 Tax=Nematostella vectensis TaxID=45351 RepID=A7RXM0_NEMVE|nr:predicted protein [Nematostella vectensis]|eukprot:XP_001635861.1 predicted protein [Nematostella vectensis]